MPLFTITRKKSFLDTVIDADLCRGSGFQNGKQRLKEFYNLPISKKERANKIKDEYGIGGFGQPLDGDGLHGENHDSTGLTIEYRENGVNKMYKMSWLEVEQRIGVLINENIY